MAGAAALPPELIQRVFLVHQNMLDLRQRYAFIAHLLLLSPEAHNVDSAWPRPRLSTRRLQVQAVCRAWRAALAGLHVRELTLYPSCASIAKWVVRTRPQVARLTVCSGKPDLYYLAVHSVDRQVLGLAWWVLCGQQGKDLQCSSLQALHVH